MTRIEFKQLARKLPVRSDLHVARKIWHMGMGLLIVLVYALTGMSQSMGAFCLGIALAFFVIVESVRLMNPAFNQITVKVMRPFMRAKEINRFSGAPYYVCAAMLSIGIFPKTIAILSVLYLAFGDPIASIFGILFGDRGPKFANNQKSFIGTAAAVMTCILITFLIMSSHNLPFSTLLGISLLGGVAGGVAEVLPLEVDDNFSIPLVSGFILWLAFIVFGI
jgi:diacylglycerol kinase (CTP)